MRWGKICNGYYAILSECELRFGRIDIPLSITCTTVGSYAKKEGKKFRAIYGNIYDGH
jgi:hypothetical protein